jgi:hypothetical protein
MFSPHGGAEERLEGQEKGVASKNTGAAARRLLQAYSEGTAMP